MNSTNQKTNLRTPQDHALVGKAAGIPINEATTVISASPVVISAPTRIFDLQLRVSAPLTGINLPIVLLSHGQGQSNHLSSSNGYGPLVNFWAAHGFVVIQPTHLSSKSLSLEPKTPGAPLFWRSRAEDMKHIVDHLADIEIAVPMIKGRLDRERIAVAGHSMGGQTASLLLGAQLVDPEDGGIVNMADPRIKAGILLSPPGSGGSDLSTFAFENYHFLREPSFTTMEKPTLVVVGDSDDPKHLSVRGPDWYTDSYHLSPGTKSLLTLVGGKHGLGGISGFDAGETTDESPERVALVQRLTWAFLRSTLYPEDRAWPAACTAFESLQELGKIENKQV